MRKIEEYRTNAERCLLLARKSADHEEKERLEKMAEVWGALADYREAALERSE